ncbi:MAG: penicillin acylase family protein, partial [Methylocella sp.]
AARDRSEPLTHWTWLSEFNRLVFADELGDSFERFNNWDFISPDELHRSRSMTWCDNIATPETETCADQGQRALATAHDRLTDAYGSNPANWRWGDAHRARFPHPLFDRIPVLRDFVHSPIATGGDNFTLNRGTFQYDADRAEFRHVHGPGLRAIFDLADLNKSQFIIAGGQSGNPLSPHYGDLVRRWRDGAYLTIVGGGEQVLTLMPASTPTN